MAEALDEAPFGAETLVVEAEVRCDWNALKAFYKERGIKCLNCPAAEKETFAEAAKLHGFDLDDHLKALNQLTEEHPFSGWPPTRLQRFKGWIFRALEDKPKG